MRRDTVVMETKLKSAAALRVYVVEDSPQIRERLERMISAVPRLEVVGSADNALAAVADIETLQPDALVLDIQLISGSGLDVLWRARQRQPGIHSIVLTNFSSSQHRKAAEDAGSDYFLDKTNEFSQVTLILKQWRDAKAAPSSPASFSNNS